MTVLNRIGRRKRRMCIPVIQYIRICFSQSDNLVMFYSLII
nr:MAG TPA: hypothetical protein [Bacteriophage sp.]